MLPAEQYESLKSHINAFGLKVVAADRPTSHGDLKAGADDRIVSLFSGQIMDIAAHYAHEDYTKRRKRQA